ncbi:MAG: malate dehydrogenase [Omnitrophica WOR_2 bacterium SM23_29]|nr:MAG: malate dehydrogenase [Omnitrophica WOR_2 bacterium SM23_29]
MKVAVIGAGQVGATCAQRILERRLADCVLIDLVEGLAQGKALDLGQAAAIEGYDLSITGGADYSLIKDSKVVIVTAGLARKPGMTREDLLIQNANIVKGIVEKIKTYCPESIIIMVTNPLDVMAYLAYKISGFNKERVFGMAGVLDSARFRFFIAQVLKVSPVDIETLVLGGHGDSMVPLVKYTKVEDRPITEMLSKEELDNVVKRTRDGGAEIVSLLKTSSAYYAPSSAVCEMLESVLNDRKQLLPVSAYLDGEYGLKDVYCGVPVRLGKGGVEKIVELKLSDDELSALRKSAAEVKDGIESLKNFF